VSRKVGLLPRRYNNQLDPALSRDDWTFQEERRLYRLHDELGNRWAVISSRLSTNRSDNSIKNHFYSRLRKSLRRINRLIQQSFKKQLREIQIKVLYKVIEASEEKFKA
jgi:myb proto-oncogene protein